MRLNDPNLITRFPTFKLVQNYMYKLVTMYHSTAAPPNLNCAVVQSLQLSAGINLKKRHADENYTSNKQPDARILNH